MKKLIFGILGAATGFIVFTLLDLNVSGNISIAAAAVSVFLGWLVGNLIAGRAKKATDSTKTSSFAKTVDWILVIAIIIVAVIAFIGLNK